MNEGIDMDNYQFKILIVDDERTNLEILTRILKPGGQLNGSEPIHANYALSVAKSGQSALKKAKEDRPDLILMDIIMPGMSGFEVLSALKSSDTTRSIPVIFITGLDSIEDEEKGFFLGAVDYITKPFHPSLVKARVKTHLQIVEQIRTIERLGLIDILTGIPNRRGFDNQMTSEWGLAIRGKKSIGLLMIDIDHFKQFNDLYGHQQGDEVLKTVAKVLTSTLRRPTDQVARWGGEEFAAILPDTDMQGAWMVAEGMRENIEKAFILSTDDGRPLRVTVSVGVAVEAPVMSSCVSDFFARADQALYAAKEAGRNKVCT